VSEADLSQVVFERGNILSVPSIPALAAVYSWLGWIH
jgi:hypothetical protein